MICHVVLSAVKKNKAEKGHREFGRGGSLGEVCILSEKIRHRLTRRVAARPQNQQGGSCADIWENAIPGN